MTRRLSLLAAMASNRVIGRNNALPWRLPADLKRFKALTMGQIIVMGRKTYESIGRPLPGRINIIVTRQPDLSVVGVTVTRSVEEALTACLIHPDKEIFIIGGAELYQQTLKHCQRLYLTEVQKAFEGDAFFPEFDRSDWHEIVRERHVQEEGEKLEYHFVVLERKLVA
ncbi:dihydrofolate reductase [Nitrosomonas nitrosa]|jgi:dihydrofolate reductase|uniref:Dihydrofolate reductase n=1 Tax=Nitrosomonas nitrosa TaxID=52442 RepID=A0A1I4N228_9PROT|nr:dihydrofolate reductase [Nitrosomonas nitrosa]MCO6433823.1 dihydrofolate reductase [Nitrosomonas nitrosa]SFM09632.1 dihydrofolate reductase [Nitrosomonas nitrosa]